MAGKKTLSDLGSLTAQQEAETPVTETPAAETETAAAEVAEALNVPRRQAYERALKLK